jgi:hydroxymethylpyrimidine/phosphomethylpyrimidine kinase
MIKVALTIAGSDSGGGAGIQADIKAIQANGVFAASVITAVTAQNTTAVTAAYDLPLDLIEAQIDAVMTDLPVAVVKTGMLSSAEIVELVARKMKQYGVEALVVDPVMISKSGYKLLKDDAVDAVKRSLMPLATVVTPNAHEAGLLAGLEVKTPDDAREAAKRILELGPKAVLVKGGHLAEEHESIDLLYDGKAFHSYPAPRIDTVNTHGTGCTYAAAIAANLAKGFNLRGAIARSKRYVTDAIRHGLSIGSGSGPTHHFYFMEGSGIFPAADE